MTSVQMQPQRGVPAVLPCGAIFGHVGNHISSFNDIIHILHSEFVYHLSGLTVPGDFNLSLK